MCAHNIIVFDGEKSDVIADSRDVHGVCFRLRNGAAVLLT